MTENFEQLLLPIATTVELHKSAAIAPFDMALAQFRSLAVQGLWAVEPGERRALLAEYAADLADLTAKMETMLIEQGELR